MDKPWIRWLGEFLAILLGILGAFAVDEYRENQRDRILATEYLSDLQSDLEFDLRNLDYITGRTLIELHSADYLLNEAGVDISGLSNKLEGYEPPKVKDGLQLAELGEFSWFSPNTSTYTGIISSGHFHVISDRPLRRAITAYYEGVKANNADREEFLQDATRLRDLLDANGINLFSGVNEEEIFQVKGIIPTLQHVREASHWRLVRFQETHDSVESLIVQIKERTK